MRSGQWCYGGGGHSAMGEVARALWGRWPERYGGGGQSTM